uniref:Uncharacterized protein n=1 Tax=Solanum tuberosum TaxID=4113 RepID=M1DDE8_SOLTU
MVVADVHVLAFGDQDKMMTQEWKLQLLREKAALVVLAGALNHSGVRERSGVGGPRWRPLFHSGVREREATLVNVEKNKVGEGARSWQRRGEGESICDFTGKSGDDGGDGFFHRFWP